MAEKIKKSIHKPGKQNPANKRAPAAEGIGLIVQRAGQRAADHEGARHADGSQRVQPVGVLHHFGLNRLRRNGGGKAVGGDGVGDGFQMMGGVLVGAEEGDGRFRGSE